ncbi:MAG TPA: NAD-dependent epimerase/dehydratase family protein [Candidatus Acidoferrales bacterium]|nr:NAD-dependent epimerase/dehydratase family protein [Candidatus Acidoferrales bacterium]
MHNCIWVTGGAGFVGSSLAIYCKRLWPGAEVVALDNLRRRGSELNLPRLHAAGVAFVPADIRCMEDLTAVSPQPDLILECSAEPSVLAGYGGSPEYLIHTNLTGCFHCLEIARRSRADFLFVSTSRVYPVRLLNQLCCVEGATRFELTAGQRLAGASAHGIAEEFPLEGTRSLYGMTKLAAEMMIEEYSEAYGFRCIIDRCGLLTGPWQMAKSDQGVIAQWVAWHHFGRPLRYIGFGGSGKQVRDFLHIDDFCELVADQIVRFDLYAGRHWNVGGGAVNSLSLREATDWCGRITGRRQEVSASAEERPADLRIYITDHRRVSSVNGWSPKRDAERTLTDIYNWIVSEEQTLRNVL